MTAATLIALRETFEASLIVCVLLAFLNRSKRTDFATPVWLGVGAGVAFSIGLALLISAVGDAMTEEMEEAYEGFMMLLASGLLLWMIAWTARSGSMIKAQLEQRMTLHIAGGSVLGIFLLSFFSTAREGAEMALMVQASVMAGSGSLHALAGTALGIVVALVIGVLLYKGIRFVPIGRFFTVTGILLLILGMGLTMHGIGELQEAHLLNFWQTQAWDTTGILADGSFLYELAKILIGYTPTPTVLQVAGGGLYGLAALGTWKAVTRTRR